MVVRLPKGYDNAWQAQMSAAANLAVEAGRAAGQGWSDLGRGIGAGLAGFAGAQQQKQARQDRMTQQTFENDMTRRQMEFTELRGRYGIMDDLYNSARSESQQAAELLMLNPKDPAAKAAFDAAQAKVSQYEAARGALGTQVAAWQMQAQQSGGGCANGRCGTRPPPMASTPAAAPPTAAPAATGATVESAPSTEIPFDASGYETSPAADADPRVAYDRAVAELQAASRMAQTVKSPTARVAAEARVRDANLRVAALKTAAEDEDLRRKATAQRQAAYDFDVAKAKEDEARARAEAEKRLPARKELATRLGWKYGDITVENLDMVDKFIEKSLQAGKEKDVAGYKDALADENRVAYWSQQEKMLGLRSGFAEKMAERKQGYVLDRMKASMELKDKLASRADARGANKAKIDKLNIEHDNYLSAAARYAESASDLEFDGSEKSMALAAQYRAKAEAEMAKAARVNERLSLFVGDEAPTAPAAPAPAAPATTATPDAAAKQSAAAEFKALPEAERTPAKWTEIKAKYGIK